MRADAKICGVTRPEDARAALASGALHVGVVFADGPRRVDVPGARRIVDAAGAARVMAVFGATTAAAVLTLRDRAGFGGAQLHGAHTRGDASLLRREGLVVWRVVHLAAAADLDLLPDAAQDADAVVVEPAVAGRPGGTGQALDPRLAIAARERLHGARMVLAGGLRPESVAAAIALVGPDVVDVSSGVESRPGVKDPERIRRFMEALA